MSQKLILAGLIFIVISITLGAFAAHGLEAMNVPQEQIDSFNVGVRYLFYNGLGMMVISAIYDKLDFTLKPQYRGILWGTIIFSSSIFGLVLLPQLNIDINKFLGPITPIGGMIMIFGWFTLMVKYMRTYTSQ